MLLKELIEVLTEEEKLKVLNLKEVQVQDLCMNSKFCKKGDLFFCINGNNVDSHNFAYEVVMKGAVGIVCERELDVKIPQIIVKNSRKAMGIISKKFNNNSCDNLKIIGVTGTNGKTTTSYMLASILKHAGKKVGIIGTLGIYYDNKKIAPELTTPDSIYLHDVFLDMVKCKVEYVVMEVSAHALYFDKDIGIKYLACIFTNLTQDHLDFFDNMENYMNAKKKMFQKDKCDLAIINGDDPNGKNIIENYDGKILYYSLNNPLDTYSIITEENIKYSKFILNLSNKLCYITLPLIGKHNIYNAIAAATCAFNIGIDVNAIEKGLINMECVNGRLEYVTSFNEGDIFVDFAHTPDGLEKSLNTLKMHCKGRLICLFGCGGNRDRKKRAPMGEIVARLADFGIITSDNPRYEDPMDIISDIEKGYRKVTIKYVAISNRKKAIEYALNKLKKGDVLLVAGKGGEDFQEIMGIKYIYNDKAIIMEEINKSKSLNLNL